MDSYSLERWLMERHRAVVNQAEARSRLQGWRSQDRLSELVAARLRQLADKLDGHLQQSPSSPRPSTR